jgi:hypothetical protein
VLKPKLLVTALTIASAVVLVSAAPAQAYTAHKRIDLRVLVVTDGGAGVDTIVAQLDREGVPYDTIDLRQSGRPLVSGSTLSDTVNGVPRAKYQGVILPNESALPAAESTALATYESTFGIRQIDAYTWANPAVGETTSWSGTLDGATLTVTNAAKSAGFGYLNGTLAVDDRDPIVPESYGYLGTAVDPATFTPLVTATAPGGGPTGSLMGVYAHDGRQELVITLAANRYQTHAMVLGHGLVSWLTQGVHLGYWRNFFTVHVDDVFMADDRWDAAANCTVGDDCNPNRDPSISPYNSQIRMTTADVTALEQWQQARGFKVDMLFNGQGSDEAGGTANDPLSAKLVTDRATFRWVSHTYSHAYLGCVQDFTVVPWRCATDPVTGATQWVSQAAIAAEINSNLTWAQGKGISVDRSELVTGEHSGLRSLPQMTTDNPNLGPALSQTGVLYLGSDASREPSPRPAGPARTVPRHPTNIYYNVATTAEEVDEYNWIYTSRANGGSGICEDNPATSTCINPLPTSTGFTDYIVPIETRIAFDHVVSADADPHYAHQSNLAGDRILYPVLNGVLDRYAATFTAATPIVNPRFSDASTYQTQQSTWQTSRSVEAYLLDGRVTVINRTSTMDIPITVPEGTRTVTLSLLGVEILGGLYGSPYGGERSAWTRLGGLNAQQLLKLPS